MSHIGHRASKRSRRERRRLGLLTQGCWQQWFSFKQCYEGVGTMRTSQSPVATKTVFRLLFAVVLSATIAAATAVPVEAKPPQKTSNSAAVSAKKQGKIKAAKEGKAKAAA